MGKKYLMLVYSTMLMLPILAILSPLRTVGILNVGLKWLYGFLLIVIIGLRHEVGGDWFGYIDNYLPLVNSSLIDAMTITSHSGEIGYEFVHWISWNYLGGVYFTNIVCASIYVFGLVKLSNRMPNTWVALLVSIPYMTIVVAMGYTRQSAAIGFIMLAIISILERRLIKYLFFMILAMSFHKTSLFFLPVGLLFHRKIADFKTIILMGVILPISFFIVIYNEINSMIYHYVTNSLFRSVGAQYRIMMNVIPALLFFLYYKEWRYIYGDNKMWVITGLLSLLLFMFSFVSSTTADRLSLFLIPTQIIILSRVPILMRSTRMQMIYVIIIIFSYSMVLYIWLFFGIHSKFWIPYSNILFLL